MILGFDVGGTNARALLIEPETGDIIDRDRESSAGTGPVLLETLVRMIDRMTRNHDGELEGVGLGVAGLAHRSGVIHYSPNLPDLVEYPLGTELAGRTGLDVTVMNDATAATWAEGKLGAGRGSDDYMLITLGTGIGSGFVCGGRLIHGHNGFAGESGHMVVARTARPTTPASGAPGSTTHQVRHSVRSDAPRPRSASSLPRSAWPVRSPQSPASRSPRR